MSRYLSTVRYASRTTGVNFEKILTWGAIGAGLYLALKVVGLIQSAGSVLTTTGSAIGTGLYDFFHPDTFGESLYYNVMFPDGQRHAVPSRSVNSDGLFRNSNLSPQYAGDGRMYRILVRKSDGAKSAVLA